MNNNTTQDFLSRPKKTHAYRKKAVVSDGGSDRVKKDKDKDAQVLIVDPGIVVIHG